MLSLHRVQLSSPLRFKHLSRHTQHRFIFCLEMIIGDTNIPYSLGNVEWHLNSVHENMFFQSLFEGAWDCLFHECLLRALEIPEPLSPNK